MILGLDIGTSKIAAVLVDEGHRVQAVASLSHHAGLTGQTGHAEQDPARLEEVAWQCVCLLPAELRRQVRAVGLTGQMHGVLLVDGGMQAAGPLITWQDMRCTVGFLDDLQARTGYRLSSGFGCATLAWLKAYNAVPTTVAGACTIHDYLTARLCALPHPVTDPTDAASWGVFDIRTLAWDFSAIERAGIDPRLLPTVQPCGSRAGTMSDAMATKLGIPAGIPVAVAIGDNQASLLAMLREPEHELALTMGTGGQLSVVMPAGSAIDPAAAATFEYRPYPDGRYLAVAAALCGGAAWAWLADTAQAWLSDLGMPSLPEDDLYARLNSLGLTADRELIVHPHFLGERYDPDLRGSIEKMNLTNTHLGPLARGLARGILENLREMLPPDLLAGRTRLLGSGNALRRNPLLRQMVTAVFRLPLEMVDDGEEAATGAAVNARGLVSS